MTADVRAPQRGEVMAWFYDVNGQMLGFTLNDAPYFYVRNLQGDVTHVLDENGSVVAEYRYDAWGNVLHATGPMAEINPITYRGYYKDWVTGLYYLQSRYYCPALRRFISADVYMDTGQQVLGTNMYMYCLNDPINMIDPEGTAAIFAVIYTWGPGIPFVGHSVLMIQDANGDWWWTEFRSGAGESVLEGKSNAFVLTRRAIQSDWELIATPVNNTLTRGAQAIRLEGDFTQSLELAHEFAARDWDYHFTFNNCLHYSIAILNASPDYRGSIMEMFPQASLPTTIPSVFYGMLVARARMSGESRPTGFVDAVRRRWNAGFF